MGKKLPTEVSFRSARGKAWFSFALAMLLSVLWAALASAWFLRFGMPFRLPQSTFARPVGARLTRGEAIKIAQAEAERMGVRLNNYEKPIADYNIPFEHETWWVQIG